MPLYVVERDVSDMTMDQLDMVRRKADTICRRMRRNGKQARYLRSVLVPGQSRCLCLFDAPDPQLVRQVNEIGGLPYLRILIALDLQAAYTDSDSM